MPRSSRSGCEKPAFSSLTPEAKKSVLVLRVDSVAEPDSQSPCGGQETAGSQWRAKCIPELADERTRGRVERTTWLSPKLPTKVG